MCADVLRPLLALLLLGTVLVPQSEAQDREPAASAAAGTRDPGARTFEFGTTTRLPAGFARAGEVELWIPVPVSNGYQDVAVLGWSAVDAVGAPVACGAAVELAAEPASGNTLLHLRVPQGESPELQVLARYRVTRHAQRRDARPDGSGVEDPAARLLADRLVPLDGAIAEIAAQVSGEGEPCALGRALFEEVRARMTYDKVEPGWGLGDALRACAVGKGNCTDFHALFMGLARARGVPARFTIGLSLPEGPADGSALSGYHCWAEFLCAEHGWVPVDISEADKAPERAEDYFGRLTTNRVALTSGRDLVLAPAQHGGPVNFLVHPYAERGGAPLDAESTKAIEHVVSARDV